MRGDAVGSPTVNCAGLQAVLGPSPLQYRIAAQNCVQRLDLKIAFDEELGYGHRVPLSSRISCSFGMAEAKNSECVVMMNWQSGPILGSAAKALCCSGGYPPPAAHSKLSVDGTGSGQILDAVGVERALPTGEADHRSIVRHDIPAPGGSADRSAGKKIFRCPPNAADVALVVDPAAWHWSIPAAD
jgi:hypothetical protein